MLLLLVSYLVGFLLLALAVFLLLLFFSLLFAPPRRIRATKQWHEYES